MRCRRAPHLLFVLVAAALAAGSGCDDPQSSRGTVDPNAFRGDYDGAALVFQLDAVDGQPTALALFATRLDFDPTTDELRAQVAVQNRGSGTVVGPASIEVFAFAPSTVEPLNAECNDASPGVCAFDYRGAYGSDGLLLPGESSTPVEWRLRVPGGESFAFRARLGDPRAASGTIAGDVFHDENGDGVRTSGEPGVAGIRVRMRSGTNSTSTRTNAAGRYSFTVEAPSLYEIRSEAGTQWHPVPADPLEVAILRQPDGTLSSFTAANLGLAPGPAGPSVRVVGNVFRDSDHDGVRDSGEPGIANVKIEGQACDTDDLVLADEDDIETRSDANGDYVLYLPDCGGPWKVQASSVDGHDRTTAGSRTFSTPRDDGLPFEADFGYVLEDVSTAWEIHGVVFRDDDGDGVRDLGEPGIAGVLVTADGTSCDAPVNGSDRTDSSGRYEIDGTDLACPLPWTVSRSALPGAIDTTPASVVLDTAPFVDRFNVDFGVRPAP